MQLMPANRTNQKTQQKRRPNKINKAKQQQGDGALTTAALLDDAAGLWLPPTPPGLGGEGYDPANLMLSTPGGVDDELTQPEDDGLPAALPVVPPIGDAMESSATGALLPLPLVPPTGDAMEDSTTGASQPLRAAPSTGDAVESYTTGVKRATRLLEKSRWVPVGRIHMCVLFAAH
jgi:hypothetical protein